MEENKRKAMSETNPTKKAALIQSIEEDGSLLQQKYKKKKELSDKFKFDPKKKVDDLIEAMKKAIAKGRKKKPDGSGGGSNKSSDSSDTDSSDSDDDENSDDDNDKKKKKKTKGKVSNSDWPQENKQLLIMTGLGLLVLIWFMNQQEEEF